MTPSERSIFGSLLLLVVLISPVYALGGGWRVDIPNTSQTDSYFIAYNGRDRWDTGTTSILSVEMHVDRVGGVMRSVITDSISLALITENQKYFQKRIRDIRDLREGDVWGPFKFEFGLTDANVGISAGASVRGEIKIAVAFDEVVAKTGQRFSHNTTNPDRILILISSPLSQQHIANESRGQGSVYLLGFGMITAIIAGLVLAVILLRRQDIRFSP